MQLDCKEWLYLHGVREVIYMNMASYKIIAVTNLVETE